MYISLFTQITNNNKTTVRAEEKGVI